MPLMSECPRCGFKPESPLETIKLSDNLRTLWTSYAAASDEYAITARRGAAVATGKRWRKLCLAIGDELPGRNPHLVLLALENSEVTPCR